jgi:protein TonB
MVQFAPVRLPPGLATDAPPTRTLPFEYALLHHAGIARQRTTTLAVSLGVHGVLLAVVILVPLFSYEFLPAPGEVTRAFFVAPPDAAPPPPPPPPPPAGARALAKAPAAPTPPPTDAQVVAPVEVPEVVKPAESLELGVAGGVPGGVEGGVPGGVLGGVVGGLPTPAPPPPAPRVVRVGGQVKAPALVYRVEPVYPDLAVQARLGAIVIVEAFVDREGHVKSVTVLRGAPLFDEPAVAAVKQWRYKPLLLNGVPTEFLLTATVKFRIDNPQQLPGRN